MSFKFKTIIGILFLVIFIGGAYFVYNKLSGMNQPDIGIPNTTHENNNLEENMDSEEKTQETENDQKNESEEHEADGESEPEKLQAFDITVYDAEGNTVKLSDFYGKPIIINFWATWCPYCVEEMPLFEENYKKYKDDIHFMMVDSVDGQRETKEKGEEFIKENGYTFPVYYDTELDATIAYEAYSLPRTVFIDKDGYIIAYQPGMLSRDLFQKGIDLILE